VISPSQTPLSDNTQHSQQKRHPCTWWDSKPTIPASEWPQNHALDRGAAGIGKYIYSWFLIKINYTFPWKY